MGRSTVDRHGEILNEGDWVIRTVYPQQELDFTFSTTQPYKIKELRDYQYITVYIPECPKYESSLFCADRFIRVKNAEQELEEVF